MKSVQVTYLIMGVKNNPNISQGNVKIMPPFFIHINSLFLSNRSISNELQV